LLPVRLVRRITADLSMVAPAALSTLGRVAALTCTQTMAALVAAARHTTWRHGLIGRQGRPEMVMPLCTLLTAPVRLARGILQTCMVADAPLKCMVAG
jgi:hypothetical protein